MSLLERHLGFVAALRDAGLPVSLAEGRDAVDALGLTGLADRALVKEAYAATLVKRQCATADVRPSLRRVVPAARRLGTSYADGPVGPAAYDVREGPVRDNAEAFRDFRERLAEAMEAGDQQQLRALAVEAVQRFGAMPGRGPGLSSWSAYTTLQRVSPSELVGRIVDALRSDGLTEEEAERGARSRVDRFTGLVESDARRRIAEEKGPEHVTDVTDRPTIDRDDITAARRADLVEMRREIQPLARRLATRLTKERHAQRRGALDFRRTVRASVSTGGVPLTTHHRPKRPHRTELVVLCDVSGSVANFAQFTLMLVFALREQFTKVQAFTFIDHVHEVTHHFRPGADPADVMSELAAATAHAALWGRTNYGRAFTTFAERYADALGPKSSLLILGDARSNYSDLSLPALRELVDNTRHAWWLNPEHRRHWDTGDSAASQYAAIVPMVECRNLTQLGDFVHDLGVTPRGPGI